MRPTGSPPEAGSSDGRPGVRGGRLAAAALGALAILVPRAAAACPVCAGNEPGGPGKIVALGAMILLPFFIALAVARVVRSVAGDEAEVGSPDRTLEEMDP